MDPAFKLNPDPEDFFIIAGIYFLQWIWIPNRDPQNPLIPDPIRIQNPDPYYAQL
jgi:hypothetical protein